MEPSNEVPGMRESLQTGASSCDHPERTRCNRWCGPLGQGSQRAAILALASTAFGSGVLALPWVFSQMGIALGLAMLIFSGLVSLLSQRLLANAAYATGLSSFAGITNKTLGNVAAVALDSIIFIFAFGSVCGYFVFISQFGPPLCESLKLPSWLSDKDEGARNIILILAIFPQTPLCCLRSLDKLKYATLGGIASLLVVCIIIAGLMPSQHAELMSDNGTSPIDPSLMTPGWWLAPHFSSWEKFPAAMAVCFYSFCCHVNLFAKFRELNAPRPNRVNKVLVNSVVLEIVIYAVVGICGFLALGEACTESVPSEHSPSCTPLDVLASPRFSGAISVVARICMVFVLLVAIPLNVAAGREIVEQRILGWWTGYEFSSSPAPSPPSSPPSSPGPYTTPPGTLSAGEPPQLSLVAHLALSLSFLYLSAFIAIIYPQLNAILSILGGFCAVTFMFTIPIAASLVLYFGHQENPDGTWRRGSIGRRRSVDTPQIGTFWGVTKRGIILASVITSVCICVGYLSAILALVNMVTGKS